MRWRLMKWQRENGLKSNFISKKIGVAPSGWTKIINGEQRPTLDQIQALRKVFGLENVLELLEENENNGEG